MKNRSKLIGLFSLAAFTFAVGGCQSMDDELGTLHNDEVQQGDKVQVTFQAVAPTVGTEGSRTTLVDGKSVYWNSGDAIAVFPQHVYKMTDEYKFIADIPEGKMAQNAAFIGYVDTECDIYTALYPFELAVDYGYYGTDEIGFIISGQQPATPGSFASTMNPAWAQTDTLGGELSFQNIGALVKFTLTDVVPDLESITLVDNGERMLTGDFILNIEDPKVPVLATGRKWYTSNSGSVKMAGNFQEGQSYYFVIAPLEGVLSDGFSMIFRRADGTSFVKKGKAGVITNLQSSQIADLGEISLKNATFTKTIADLNFIAAVENATGIEWEKNSDGTVPLTEDNISKMRVINSLKIRSAGICSLEGIEYFTGLEQLDCLGNQLVELNVSDLKNLKRLDCSMNSLYNLNVSGLTSLTYLSCGANLLTSLDLSGITQLDSLGCYNNQIEELDVKNLVNLSWLSCEVNRLKDLDISGLTNLRKLICSTNFIEVLDVANLVNLTYLDCCDNQISVLDVKDLVNLYFLQCCTNVIEELNVSALERLNGFNCYANRLSTLDISNQRYLTYLGCSNQLNNNTDSKLHLTLNETLRSWWDSLDESQKQTMEVVKWVE